MTYSFEELLFADVLAEHRANELNRRLRRYGEDPVAFVHDCFAWPEGGGPTEYQDAVLCALTEHKKVAVRACHGTAKTCTAALAVLWFAMTRDAAGVDWKAVTTAGAW
jgi:hypothetical protein